MTDHTPPSLAEVRRYYREHPSLVSSPFGAAPRVDGALFLAVLGRLGITIAGRRVFDVGCGRGGLASVCLEAGAVYTGIDVLLDHLLPAPGAWYLAGDAVRLPLVDGCADVLLCVDVFEHIPDQATAAQEFLRVLVPGGMLFLSVPNYSNVAGLLKWWYERRGYCTPNSWAPFGRWQPQVLEQFVTPRRVRRLLAGAGFCAPRMLGFEREWLDGLLPWLQKGNWHEGLADRVRRGSHSLCALGAQLFPALSLHTFWCARRP